MARELELEVANFVCRFTDSVVLVDLLDEVVLPAFFAGTTRSYKETEYFFTDADFRYLDKNDPHSLALTCRFIKNTVLRRHQYYTQQKGIVPDPKSLDSAPSSVAALLLESHRLLYVREVPSAPSMSQFGSTFGYFVKDAVVAYRDSLFQQSKKQGKQPGQDGKRLTKKALKELIPFPDISVVPVVSSDSLKDFVNRFETLSTIKIEIAPTNNELDNRPLFQKLRDVKKQVGATRTVIQHHNSKGLDKPGTIEHVEAAKQGNALVEMRGEDKQGDQLIGDNSQFSVKAGLGITEGAVDRTAKAAFKKYDELIEEEVIEVGKSRDNVADKILASYQRFKKEQSNG